MKLVCVAVRVARGVGVVSCLSFKFDAVNGRIKKATVRRIPRVTTGELITHNPWSERRVHLANLTTFARLTREMSVVLT